MNSFSLLCCLIVGALSLGAPVSSSAQERPQSRGTNEAKKPDKGGYANGRARLKLEPLDLSIEADPQLKSSESLGDLPQGPPLQRAQAAALWQALNTSAEDVLRDAQRGQALAADMGKLREAVMRNKNQLSQLRVQLAQAQESRTHWRHALMAVLGITLLLVLLAWRRFAARGRDSEWWAGSGDTFAESGSDNISYTKHPRTLSEDR